ncbi:MAG: UDP-N-acetylmuramoyl-tripeptide--D-alanyl-D-alanine ligase [bacterium]
MAEPNGALSLADVLAYTGGVSAGATEERAFSRVSTDSRNIERGDLFVALRGERFDGHAFSGEALKKGAAGLLVERLPAPEILQEFRPALIRVEDTLEALGGLAAGWRRRFSAPVAVLTGSNGKTTTKEMTVTILRLGYRCLWSPGNFNNRIGLPLTLLMLREDHERVVLEMGMNRPGEIRELTRIARPEVGALLNIGPAHLERFGSIEGVAAAKAELLEEMPRESVLVFNRDDPRISLLADRWGGPKRSFGFGSGSDVRFLEETDSALPRKIRLEIAGREVEAALALPGRHNLYNALAAAALAHSLGASVDAIAEGLSRFQGISGRFTVESRERFTLVNDTYNANPGSMEAALETLGDLSRSAGRVLVLGDMLELGDESDQAHFELGRRAARLHPTALYVTGSFAGKVVEGARHAGYPQEQIEVFEDPARAAEQILRRIRGGEWILIKGSRGMAMERVAEALDRRSGSGAAKTPGAEAGERCQH